MGAGIRHAINRLQDRARYGYLVFQAVSLIRETAMLLFTAKTRRLIDSAVQRLPDEPSRQLWQTWAKENPQLRRRDGIADDGGPPPPHAGLCWSC